MKITKLIMAACILTGMAACDTDKDIAVYGDCLLYTSDAADERIV